MEQVSVVGLDLAKSVFQVHGVNAQGEAVLRRRLTRGQLLKLFEKLPPWRCSNTPGYEAGSALQMTTKYLGVWDTVDALGLPDILPGSDWFNREYDYHDASLDAFVENARHAVAIDERRKLFPAVPFDDINGLNAVRGFASEDEDAPYQERWIPGVHGSVGGGGDIRGLSANQNRHCTFARRDSRVICSEIID